MQNWRFNADVGEGCDDALIMPYLDEANVCCGAHAGGSAEMRHTLQLAKQHQVRVGAHPGYPDRANFGRLSLDLPLDLLAASLREQMQAIQAAAVEVGIALSYLKPHGALNHDMLQNDAIFTLLCQIAAEEALSLLVPTNARQAEQSAIAAQYDVAIEWEVFADRAYEPSGLLRPRRYPDAMHQDPAQIVAQMQRIVAQGSIIAIDGSAIDVSSGNSICIHGDHAPSIAALKTYRETTC